MTKRKLELLITELLDEVSRLGTHTPGPTKESCLLSSADWAYLAVLDDTNSDYAWCRSLAWRIEARYRL